MSSSAAARVAIITGSSSGIGAATALAFSSGGSAAGGLVLTGRDSDKLAAVQQRCTEKGQGKDKILSVVADITVEDDRRRLVDETLKKFGRIDILVNNAGMVVRNTLASCADLKDYDRTMDVNVRSVMALTQLCVPHLKKSAPSNIVNVSSVAGLLPRPTLAYYCMSKATLEMYAKCLAAELGPSGVRVNNVNPAVIETPFFERSGVDAEGYNKIMDDVKSNYPLGRAGKPEEIANLIMFIVGAKGATFCTGHSFVADGGVMCSAR